MMTPHERVVQTKTGKHLVSSRWSNDRRVEYKGRIIGMRRVIVKWHVDNHKALPKGFENRPSTAIWGMYNSMKNQGHFGD